MTDSSSNRISKISTYCTLHKNQPPKWNYAHALIRQLMLYIGCNTLCFYNWIWWSLEMYFYVFSFCFRSRRIANTGDSLIHNLILDESFEFCFKYSFLFLHIFTHTHTHYFLSFSFHIFRLATFFNGKVCYLMCIFIVTRGDLNVIISRKPERKQKGKEKKRRSNKSEIVCKTSRIGQFSLVFFVFIFTQIKINLNRWLIVMVFKKWMLIQMLDWIFGSHACSAII